MVVEMASLQKLSFLFLVSSFLLTFILETCGVPTTSPSSSMEMEGDDFCMQAPGPDEESESHNITVLLNCVKRLGLSETSVIVYDEKLVQNDYDDKCLARCVYTDHKLLNTDGEPLREAFIDDVKGFVSGKSQEGLINIVNSCITGAINKADKVGGPKAIPCKFAAMLAHCFVNELDKVKFCDKPKKKK